MIIFTWTLTPNQIEIIKGIADYIDGGEQESEMCPGIRNFVGGVKTLLRERFITHTEVPVTGKEKPGWTGKTRPKWDVTEKGRLILHLVEMEIADQKNQLRQLDFAKSRKKIA